MKLKNNHILAACVALLAVLCFLSVYAPIRFGRERMRREAQVKRRLMAIRTAEERYRARHKTYCAHFATLVGEGFLADSLQYIPYTSKRPFHLMVSTEILKSGKQVPLMECAASYDEYLQGLDANSIAALNAEAAATGQFAGLKIGDVSAPNGNVGNWE